MTSIENQEEKLYKKKNNELTYIIHKSSVGKKSIYTMALCQGQYTGIGTSKSYII